MNPETEQFINAVRTRYDYLQLSTVQANEVLQWQQQPTTYGINVQTFSFWEELNFTLDKFRIILTDSQFFKYEEEQQKTVHAYEQTLMKKDADQSNELFFQEEWTGWLKEVFVPGFQKSALKEGILFSFERDKINYLRLEYQTFLAEQRQNTLVKHYRYSQRLQPNTLKLAMLRLGQLQLMPDYSSFMSWGDDAVKAVAAFLLEKYRGFGKTKAAFFQQKLEETEERLQRMREKYPRKPIRGWHSTITPSNALPVEEHGLMCLMLMEK
jgi:hypothetical protein